MQTEAVFFKAWTRISVTFLIIFLFLSCSWCIQIAVQSCFFFFFWLKLRIWNRRGKKCETQFPRLIRCRPMSSAQTPSCLVVWSWRRRHPNCCHNNAGLQIWRRLLEMGENHFEIYDQSILFHNSCTDFRYSNLSDDSTLKLVDSQILLYKCSQESLYRIQLLLLIWSTFKIQIDASMQVATWHNLRSVFQYKKKWANVREMEKSKATESRI